MTFMFRFAVLCAGLGSVPAALAHNHLTVDTLAGREGDPVIIVAGYYESESEWSIGEDGRLLYDGQIAVYEAGAALQDGPFRGWAAADELSLTSDFYFATGRLDGGNFQYEIVSVVPIEGGPAAFALGVVDHGTFESDAVSDAETRLDRSFDAGVGQHRHGQAFAISENGLFDVTLVAWDSNGRYEDSEPVTFRVRASGATQQGDLNGDGCVNLSDLAILLAAFDHSADGDVDGDGDTDLADLAILLANWGEGCTQVANGR